MTGRQRQKERKKRKKHKSCKREYGMGQTDKDRGEIDREIERDKQRVDRDRQIEREIYKQRQTDRKREI